MSRRGGRLERNETPEGGSSGAPSIGAASDRAYRSRFRWLLISSIAAFVPFAILIGRLAHTSYLTTSDLSLVELHVRDIGGRHTPLVGPYSRYGWNHPGPLLYAALLIPYRVLGSTGRALLIGATLLNAGCVALAAWIGWRRGRAAGFACVLIITLMLVRALGGGVLEFPWNPYLVVLPLFVLALAAWSVMCGDHWFLPLVVLSASFVVQTHVGTAPPALVLCGAAIVAFALDAARHHAPNFGRVTIASLVTAVVLWLPPLVDQFRPHGGNLGALWRFFTSTHTNTTGAAAGARIVAAQLSVPAPWITGHVPVSPGTAGLVYSWHVPVALILVILAAALAIRRRDRTLIMLNVLAVALSLSAWFAAAHVIDVPYEYLLKWTWIVGAVAWLAIALTAWRLISSWFALPPRRVIALGVVSLCAVATMSGAASVSAARAHPPDPLVERSIQAVHQPLLRSLASAPSPVFVRVDGGFAAAAFAEAVLVCLARAHIKAGFDVSLAYMVGDGHVVSSATARTLLLVADDTDRIDALLRDPHYELVAQYDALSPSDRAFVESVTSQLAKLDTRAGLAWSAQHPAEAARFKALTAVGLHVAIFRSPMPS